MAFQKKREHDLTNIENRGKIQREERELGHQPKVWKF